MYQNCTDGAAYTDGAQVVNTCELYPQLTCTVGAEVVDGKARVAVTLKALQRVPTTPVGTQSSEHHALIDV